jgi:hypothetical protein
MILDRNDPTGLGLFSKCARSQASKLKPHRPNTAARSKSKPVQEDGNRKKSNTHYSFDMQESREQREKKYQKEDTPPVGKYNPILRVKPKMVWDILKAYGKSERNRSIPTLPHSPNETPKDKTESNRTETEQGYYTMNSKIEPSTSLNQKAEASSMISMGKHQCMVNMSRMTGRKEEQC